MSGTQVVRQVSPRGRSWGRIAFLASMGGLVLAAITVGVAKSGDEPAAAVAASSGHSAIGATAGDSDQTVADPKATPDAPARRAWPRSHERAADFTYQLTSAVCHRMSYCGERDEAARSICKISDSFMRTRSASRYDTYDPDYGYRAYDRDRDCDYDFAPTTACLSAIDALSCDGAPGDLPSWLHAATALPACESAYRCTN